MTIYYYSYYNYSFFNFYYYYKGGKKKWVYTCIRNINNAFSIEFVFFLLFGFFFVFFGKVILSLKVGTVVEVFDKLVFIAFVLRFFLDNLFYFL